MKVEDFIENGYKYLSSGITSNLYYNFRKMKMDDKKIIAKWLESQINDEELVGVARMGHNISVLTKFDVILYNPHIDHLSRKPKGEYVVFDDVITTGSTINKCIKKIGREPKFVLCLKNRMEIRSYF